MFSRQLVAVAVISLACLIVSSAPLAAAQQAPPALGDVILEAPLSSPSWVLPDVCSTGRASSHFDEMGLTLRVAGLCATNASTAVVRAQFQNITVPDGEVRIEFLVAQGLDRTRITLHIRMHGNGYYYMGFEPASGFVQLLKYEAGQATTIIQRKDPKLRIAGDSWNSLAIRAQGSQLTALLNDQPVLTATDVDDAPGGAMVQLRRLGDLSDEGETVATIRNLRITALAGSEQARRPSAGIPAVVPAPVATGRILLHDDFSDDTSGFSRGSNEDITVGYDTPTHSYYIIKTNPLAGFYHWFAKPEFEDLDAQVTAALEYATGPDALVSLGIRAIGPGSEYRLAVRPKQGSVAFQRLYRQGDALASEPFVRPYVHPAVAEGENTLRLIGRGSEITAIVNGVVVGTVTDTNYSRGRVSLGVYSGEGIEAKGVFRELIVRSTD